MWIPIGFLNNIWRILLVAMSGWFFCALADADDAFTKPNRDNVNTTLIPLGKIPLVFTLQVQLRSTSSCSRSHASSTQEGSLELAISKDNLATFTRQIKETFIAGPSRGAFQRGERGFDTFYKKLKQVWTGKCVRKGNGLKIKFEKHTSSKIEYRGHKEFDYPLATTSPAKLTLTCQMETLPVYPARKSSEIVLDTQGEKTVLTPVLKCLPNQVPDLIGSQWLFEGNFLLGPAPGLFMARRSSSYHKESVIRMAPEK